LFFCFLAIIRPSSSYCGVSTSRGQLGLLTATDLVSRIIRLKMLL